MKKSGVFQKSAAMLTCCAVLLTSAVAAYGMHSVRQSRTTAYADSSDSVLEWDDDAWLYNSSDDVYYQYGVSYCSDPENESYETFGVYVPASYMTMTKSGSTYTFEGFTETAVGGYTSSTAPIVMPVNTSGYSAQAAPTGYASEAGTYTAEGFIYLYAGCRGRTISNGGAPWGVTDLKAAIRFYRAHSDSLPGDTDSIFSFGHSGGGAQSAVLGASGDSELYYPYLYSIGAEGIAYDESTNTYTSSISDATCGAMCWCPITSLDYADEAYEWMMGQYDTSDSTRSDGTWTSELSADMSEAFAEYINGLSLKDEDGNVLSLSESDDGIYASGTYYNYLLYQIEYSLNDFIDAYTDSDGEFSYSSSSSSSSSGGPGDLPSGGISIASSSSSTAMTLSEYLSDLDENYGTDDAWITYDEEEDWYEIRSIEDFVLSGSKSASKSVGAFDDLNYSQAENAVFGSGSDASKHFDSVMAELMTGNASEYASADSSVSEDDIKEYAEAYTTDYSTYTDSLGFSSQYRQNMYNPMYYLCGSYDGCGSSSVAPHWRINTGITQSDTSITVETNLYLALLEAIDEGTVEDVDFSMLWAQGHTTAERAGADSDECFIAWVNECLSGTGSDSGTDTEEETSDSSVIETENSSEDASHKVLFLVIGCAVAGAAVLAVVLILTVRFIRKKKRQ